MNLGLHLETIGLQLGQHAQLNAARQAEDVGYHSVWTSESFGSEASSLAAWIAGATRTIKLGGAVWQIPGRTPAMTAMTAATIDRISGGRLILGLGSSSPHISASWHGQAFGRQLQRTREYFEVVRLALRGEPLVYHGETLELPLAETAAHQYSLVIEANQERIPIYLGAVGPKNTALAGEIADGWIPTFFAPEHAERFRKLLADGAARAGRSADQVEIAPVVGFRIDDDLDAARDLVRPYLAIFVAAGGYPRQNSYATLVEDYGFPGVAAEVQDHYAAGRLEDAHRAIPDGLVDLLCLCGPAGAVGERMRAFGAAGVGTLIALPIVHDEHDTAAQIGALAEAAAI